LAIQPLFIFSITRSGSTLLQRVLATYDEIGTVSETWLLIPQLYALRKRGIAAEYTHYLLVEAIEDFCEHLPEGEEDYRREVRELVLRLYARAAGKEGARYFLDKTPPYFFVVEDVMNLFPDGKYVFLWRNPLAVIASLIEWDSGAWDPARYSENLFTGIAQLLAAWKRGGDRACAVRYEDLIGGGEAEWRRISAYLELDFDPDSLHEFSDVKLEGRMGDPYGVKLYSELSPEPLTKWRRSIDNPIRKAWCARYLRWIGEERLAAMGYDLDTLLAELSAVPSTPRNVAGDSARVARALIREPLRARSRRSVGLRGPSAFRYILDRPT
jgi:hypothetical protein